MKNALARVWVGIPHVEYLHRELARDTWVSGDPTTYRDGIIMATVFAMNAVCIKETQNPKDQGLSVWQVERGSLRRNTVTSSRVELTANFNF